MKVAATATRRTTTRRRQTSISNTRRNKRQQELEKIDEDYDLKGYPKSEFFTVGLDLSIAHHDEEAINAFHRGAAQDGCVACIFFYVSFQIKKGDNTGIHLALPWALEGAIRGHYGCINRLVRVFYNHATLSRQSHALASFWVKIMIELGNTIQDCTEERRKAYKKKIANRCFICQKTEDDKDSNDNTITLVKCGKCKHYSYCGKACQLYHWKESSSSSSEGGGGCGHINECRHLTILHKYYKSHHVKEIREAIIRGDDPTQISRLQLLRTKLGLSRPKEEYQDLLLRLDDNNNNNNNNNTSINPYDYLVARKDGTVHIGSTPDVI